MSEEATQEPQKGSMELLQQEWQKGFFASLEGLPSKISAPQVSNASALIENEEEQNQEEIGNTIGGAVSEVLKQSKVSQKAKGSRKNGKEKVLSKESNQPKELEATSEQSNNQLSREQKSKQWSEKEKKQFSKGLMAYGLNFQMISEYMGTKTPKQVRQRYNRESKKNKVATDDKLKYYDSNGPKKAKNFLKARFNQLRKISQKQLIDTNPQIAQPQLQLQQSIQQQFPNQPSISLSTQLSNSLSQVNSYSLTQMDSTNSAHDFLEQKLMNIYGKIIAEQNTEKKACIDEEQKLNLPNIENHNGE